MPLLLIAVLISDLKFDISFIPTTRYQAIMESGREGLGDRLSALPGGERSSNNLPVPSAARPSRLGGSIQPAVAVGSELKGSDHLHFSPQTSAPIRRQAAWPPPAKPLRDSRMQSIAPPERQTKIIPPVVKQYYPIRRMVPPPRQDEGRSQLGQDKPGRKGAPAQGNVLSKFDFEGFLSDDVSFFFCSSLAPQASRARDTAS